MTLFGNSTARRCSSMAGSRNNASASRKAIPPHHWQVCRYGRRWRVLKSSRCAAVYASETLVLHRIVHAEVNRFPEIGVLFYRYGPERNIAALAYYLQTLSEDGRLTDQDPCKTAEEFFELVRRCLHLRLRLLLGARIANRKRSRRGPGRPHRRYGSQNPAPGIRTIWFALVPVLDF